MLDRVLNTNLEALLLASNMDSYKPASQLEEIELLPRGSRLLIKSLWIIIFK